MSRPLISVIIPTYQDAEYLEGAIESVRAQTYEAVEIVVVDSGGASWVAELSDRNSDIVYDFQPPNGPAAARNRGIDLASGELIAFLDADDRWHEDKLDRQVKEIEAGADIVYSDQEITS